MGEYINNIKIGTCENLYYARYTDIEKLAETEFEARQYLYEKHNFRYRFPFPDEDHTPVGSYKNFNRGYMFYVPRHVLSDISHDLIRTPATYYRTHDIIPYPHGIELLSDCPASADSTNFIQPNSKLFPISLIQQRRINGKLYPVFRCELCGTLYREMDIQEIHNIAPFIEDPAKNSEKHMAHEIVVRILEGMSL